MTTPMDDDLPAQPAIDAADAVETVDAAATKARGDSISQQSYDSQTAADFIRDQLQMEADAREAMPYRIDTCTRHLGPLRQNVYACLTCNPPTSSSPAGICYACSVQCHGEHTLVEIFQKRNFTCDCGTTRFPASAPCALRGRASGDEPDGNNRYNQNFANRFCGCSCDYDPFEQMGTMFQCLGLDPRDAGGCGEDWYHPGCLVGMGPRWFEKMGRQSGNMKEVGREAGRGLIKSEKENWKDREGLPVISEDAEIEEAEAEIGGAKEKPHEPGQSGAGTTQELQNNDAGQGVDDNNDDDNDDDDDPPMPPGFPAEDDFETFLCYKCVEANPWIGRYAGTPGFLPAVYASPDRRVDDDDGGEAYSSRKRNADDAGGEDVACDAKRARKDADVAVFDVEVAPPTAEAVAINTTATTTTTTSNTIPSPLPCKLPSLPPAPSRPFSLFLKEDFRDRLCSCSACYRLMSRHHPQLLEEEETYEPPLSTDGDGAGGGGGRNGDGNDGNGNENPDRDADAMSTSGASGSSLLQRGESVLNNMDRVRAIEGVMAYNHLKERLRPFFQQFAASGQAISAEDVKEYFAKLRGDDKPIRSRKGGGGGGGEKDYRREQGGH